MKTRFQHIFYWILLLTIFVACSKGGTISDDSGTGPHEVTPSDTIAPVLEITTPTASHVFTSGNTISVTGRITDDLGLYRGSVRITNDANGGLLKEQLYEIHGIKLYDFNVAYPATVTTLSNYTVTVTFEDHGLNETSKSVKVKVNP